MYVLAMLLFLWEYKEDEYTLFGKPYTIALMANFDLISGDIQMRVDMLYVSTEESKEKIPISYE